MEDEGAVWQVVEPGAAEPGAARPGIEALLVEPHVDRVCPDVAVETAPPRREPAVVLAAALSARTVPGGERGRLVEEEQLRVPAGPKERRATPPPELDPARDPAPALGAPPDPTRIVVQAAPVPVHEAPPRIGDELAERRDAVLQRHRRVVAAT